MTDINNKKGRKEEPSQQELEFLFEGMARGLTPREIADEYQDTEFPLRRARWIAKKQRYYDAAKKIFEEKIKTEREPVILEAKRKHQKELMRLARQIFPRVQMPYIIPYSHTTDGDVYERPLTDQISNDDSERQLMHQCLWEHLAGKQIAKYYEQWCEKRIQLIEALQKLLGDIKQSVTEERAHALNSWATAPFTTNEDSANFVHIQSQWRDFIETLRGQGESGNLDALLRKACEPLRIEGDVLVLGFYAKFLRDRLKDQRNPQIFKENLHEFFGINYRIQNEFIARKIEPEFYDGFSATIYEHAIAGIRENQKAVESNLRYRIVKGEDVRQGILYLDETKLANLPLAVSQGLEAVHRSLLTKYASSKEARQIRSLISTVSETVSKFKDEAEIFLARGILPGKCRICKEI